MHGWPGRALARWCHVRHRPGHTFLGTRARQGAIGLKAFVSGGSPSAMQVANTGAGDASELYRGDPHAPAGEFVERSGPPVTRGSVIMGLLLRPLLLDRSRVQGLTCTRQSRHGVCRRLKARRCKCRSMARQHRHRRGWPRLDGRKNASQRDPVGQRAVMGGAARHATVDYG
jgi:hypothetical protein